MVTPFQRRLGIEDIVARFEKPLVAVSTFTPEQLRAIVSEVFPPGEQKKRPDALSYWVHFTGLAFLLYRPDHSLPKFDFEAEYDRTQRGGSREETLRWLIPSRLEESRSGILTVAEMGMDPSKLPMSHFAYYGGIYRLKKCQ